MTEKKTLVDEKNVASKSPVQKKSQKQTSTMAFVFSKENQGKIQTILNKYPPERGQSAMLPLLDLAQRQNGGWLSLPALEAVSDVLCIGVLQVWEVASFYTMFHLSPVGKYHVQVCGTTPCMLRGAENIKATCHKHLSVEDKQVTHDGVFSVEEVECLGACVNAPIVQINDHLFEDMDEESMMQLLETCRKNGLPDPYSAKGRTSAEPVQGTAQSPLAKKEGA